MKLLELTRKTILTGTMSVEDKIIPLEIEVTEKLNSPNPVFTLNKITLLHPDVFASRSIESQFIVNQTSRSRNVAAGLQEELDSHFKYMSYKDLLEWILEPVED